MHYVGMSGTACWICYVGLVAHLFVHQCTVSFCKNFEDSQDLLDYKRLIYLLIYSKNGLVSFDYDQCKFNMKQEYSSCPDANIDITGILKTN